jgi:hypothetical protein
MAEMLDKIAELGKLAARRQYRKPYLMPPKRRSKHSRLFKLRNKRDRKDVNRALNESTGNVQSPHRYGRKRQKSKT